MQRWILDPYSWQNQISKRTSSFPQKNFPPLRFLFLSQLAVCYFQWLRFIRSWSMTSNLPQPLSAARGWHRPSSCVCSEQITGCWLSHVCYLPAVYPGPHAVLEPSPQQFVCISVTQQSQTAPVVPLRVVILWLIQLEMRVRLFNWSRQLNWNLWTKSQHTHIPQTVKQNICLW